MAIFALLILSLTSAQAAGSCAPELNATGSTLCASPLTVKKWEGTAKNPSEAILTRMKKSLGLIVVAQPTTVFDRENKKVSIDGLGTGTAFALRLRHGLAWVTVAHLTIHLKNERKILLFNPDGASEVNLSSLITSHAVAEMPKDAILEDAFHPFLGPNEPGSDFAYVEHKNLSFLDQSTWAKVPGLDLRDLEKNPLKLQEPIYFAGYRKNKYKMFDCSYRGISQSNFEMNKISFLAACNNEDFALSGLSGGVFFDQNGAVIGVFTGFMDAFISGAPIYAHEAKDGSTALRPYPVRKNLQSSQSCCFACYALEPEMTDEDFLKGEAKNRSACVLRLDGKQQKLEFQKTR